MLKVKLKAIDNKSHQPPAQAVLYSKTQAIQPHSRPQEAEQAMRRKQGAEILSADEENRC